MERKEFVEKDFFETLNEGYKTAENRSQIDYWQPISHLIMESIEMRDHLQISQKELADKMKTRQSAISRFENMGRLPNYDFLSRLSLAFNNKLGITVSGDFMAVVPLHMQEEIRKISHIKGLEPQEYVQAILEDAIEDQIKCSRFEKYDSSLLTTVIDDNTYQVERNEQESDLKNINTTNTPASAALSIA